MLLVGQSGGTTAEYKLTPGPEGACTASVRGDDKETEVPNAMYETWLKRKPKGKGGPLKKGALKRPAAAKKPAGTWTEEERVPTEEEADDDEGEEEEQDEPDEVEDVDGARGHEGEARCRDFQRAEARRDVVQEGQLQRRAGIFRQQAPVVPDRQEDGRLQQEEDDEGGGDARGVAPRQQN